MLQQQRENGIINNGRSVPQTRKDYHAVVSPVGIPIPGKVARPVSAYHPSSSGFFSSSSEDDSEGSPIDGTSPPETHGLSSSYHGTGFLSSANSNNVPLNVYGTSPRTSVMFNYYSSPKGSYGRHHHPQLMSSGKSHINKPLITPSSCENVDFRTRSTDNPPSTHHFVTHSSRDNRPHYKSTDSLDNPTTANNKKIEHCKITQFCSKPKCAAKLPQHLQQQLESDRPRAWSESDKSRSNNSLQNSRMSALRKLKMKLGQKGPLKRQKPVDDDEKGKSATNVTSLEKLEEGRQLKCGSSGLNSRLQNVSLDGSSMLYQEHETSKKPERRIGVVRYTSPPQALPQVQENPEDYLVYQRFLEEHTCYDIMPTSSKLVVLDTRLEVKKAFHALIENSLRCAPLWDNELQDYIGLLTVSDFVSILLAYHKCPNKKLEDLENQKISCWRKILKSKQTLIRVTPQASLLDAIHSLTNEKIRRLAIVDPDNGDVFHVINYRRILHFLHLFINELPKPKYLSMSVGDLGLAAPKEVTTVNEDSPVIDALMLLDKHKVSGLPVVDQSGRVTDIFTKTDVLVLAGEQLFYDLSIKVSTVISLHSVDQEESSPPLNRLMPGSPALVRRRNQPKEEHPQSSTPVKAHPFLRDSDNSPRLMPSPLATKSISTNRQNNYSKTKDRNYHHRTLTTKLSGGNQTKNDATMMSPPGSQALLHRRRHLSNHLSKSTSISTHLVTVTKEDTLEVVMSNIVTADVLQAVVVDDFDHVQGVVSIGDILRYMVYPTDKSGKVIESVFESKPPLVRSTSVKTQRRASPLASRLRTASDDSDLTSSLVRKHSRSLTSSTVDSAYSDESLSVPQTPSSFTSYNDVSNNSSAEKLLGNTEEKNRKPPSVHHLKSGEKIDRL